MNLNRNDLNMLAYFLSSDIFFHYGNIVWCNTCPIIREITDLTKETYTSHSMVQSKCPL